MGHPSFCSQWVPFSVLIGGHGWSHLVSESCLFCDPMDCSLPGCSVHGISQARRLEWFAICFSSGSSQPRDWTHVSCIGRCILLSLSHQKSMDRTGLCISLLFRMSSLWQTLLRFFLFLATCPVDASAYLGALSETGIKQKLDNTQGGLLQPTSGTGMAKAECSLAHRPQHK